MAQIQRQADQLAKEYRELDTQKPMPARRRRARYNLSMLYLRGGAPAWQERIGLDGKPFPLIRFRMKQENGRYTRVGKFLRRYYIDELPQLVNVLLGHMSLVGPHLE